MGEVVAVVSRAQAERGRTEPLNRENQIIAVRSLPENEDVIRHMFGDLVVTGGDADPYDRRILPHVNKAWYPPAFRFGAYKGLVQQNVKRGDGMILSPLGLIHRYSPEQFEVEWFITGTVSEPRVSGAINRDHLPPRSKWQKPEIDNLPPKSEWPRTYWREDG